MSTNSDLQAKQEIDRWLRITFTIFGILLIILAIVFYIRFLQGDISTSSKDFEVNFLLGLGIVQVLIVNFPWSKISIGGIEIEKTITVQEQELVQEIDSLQEKINELVSSRGIHFVDAETTEIAKFQDNKEKNSKLLFDFLSKWNTWGFTASRIKNWGGKQKGFEELAQLSNTDIRQLAIKLSGEDKVISRISNNGNILYQFKK